MSRVRWLALAALAATLLVSGSAQASFPGKNGKIAFYMYRAPDPGDGYDIYVINNDGTGLAQLTTAPGNDLEADWSANGSRLVFQSDRQNTFSQEYDLYTMNADGSAPTRMTSFTGSVSGGPRSAENPSWSPDATKVAFDSGQKFGNANAWAVGADGTGLQNLAPDSYFELGPSWSPNGDRIAFPAFSNDQDGIYTVRPDGSDVRLAVPGDWNHPDWSPDATKLAFSGFGANSEIWVANVDGTGLRMLSPDDEVAEVFPTWSPDGTKIAYWRLDAHSSELWTMDTDGNNPRRVFDSGGPGATPSSWQPIPGPKRADFKNSNQFCKAEQVFWGDQFSQRYRNFGQCMSGG
jgi:Tol biopolymer transport system component